MSVTLGLVLLTAAFMKGHQLAMAPVAETDILTSRWFLIGLVEFEMAFGLWLLAALFPRETRLAAMFCFASFGAVSCYAGFSGAASCGCFGDALNPWLMAVLDVVCVSSLVVTGPGRPAYGKPFSVRRLVGVMAMSLLLGVPAATVMARQDSFGVTAEGLMVDDNGVIYLEPETWIGKPLPILSHLDNGDQLATGRWIVLMERDGCDRCERVVSVLTRNAGEFRRRFGTNVAFVEVAPSDRSRKSSLSAPSVPRRMLDSSRKWFVATPVVLVLDAGIVRDARESLPHDGGGFLEGLFDELHNTK